MRTLAREVLFKIVYSSQFVGAFDEQLKKSLFKSAELNEDDKAYCEKLLSLISEHRDELAKTIDDHSIAFPEKRIFPADRSILLIALSEILYCDDIPDKVSFNEAANIASKYSSEKSATYVTGILSAVAGDKNV